MSDSAELGFHLDGGWKPEVLTEESDSAPPVIETTAEPPRVPAGPPSPWEGLPDAAQVQVYRQSPIWARGFLQSIELPAGEPFGAHMMQQIGQYWGGGTYQLRLVMRGRHIKGGTRRFEMDGRTLEKGMPHPEDPQNRAPVYVPTQQLGYAQPQPWGQLPPAQVQLPPQLTQHQDPAIQALAGLCGQMLGGIQALTQQQSEPKVEPAKSFMEQMQEFMLFRKTMKDMEDDLYPEYEEEDEPEETRWEDMDPDARRELFMMNMAEKWFEKDEQKEKEKTAAPAAANTGPPRPGAPGGPRLIKAQDRKPSGEGGEGGAAKPTPPPTPAQAKAAAADKQSGMRAAMSALADMSPDERARTLAEVTEAAARDPETKAAMQRLMQEG